jgi:hypothetical protein
LAEGNIAKTKHHSQKKKMDNSCFIHMAYAEFMIVDPLLLHKLLLMGKATGVTMNQKSNRF